jgi:hypothetical protein
VAKGGGVAAHRGSYRSVGVPGDGKSGDPGDALGDLGHGLLVRTEVVSELEERAYLMTSISFLLVAIVRVIAESRQ